MNASKAREFFSAYYEGELTGGLKEAFERSLTSDAQLKQEYDDFCGTLKLLEEPSSEIELPHDLHDKIMARLDLEAWEEKQTNKSGWMSQWRMVLVGGLAVLTVGFGVINLSNKNSTSQSTAGIMNVSPRTVGEVVDLTTKDGSILVSIKGSKGNQYTVRNLVTGEELTKIESSEEGVTREILNEGNHAQGFSVLDSEGTEKLVIILPGSLSGTNAKGEGTVTELALAMADSMRTPMILRTTDRERTVAWDFSSSNSHDSVNASIKDAQLNVSVREDGITILSSF